MKKYFQKTVFATLAALFILTAGCQPTPSGDIVAGKDGMEQYISESAAPINPDIPTETSWTYEKEYDSGKQLIVDADIINNKTQDAPVVSICEKPFEGGEDVMRITEVMCPDAQFGEHSVVRTKQDIMDSILWHKQDLLNEQNAEHTENIEWHEQCIEDLEIEYALAPDEQDVITDYSLKPVEDGSAQLILSAKKGGRDVELVFANWAYPGSRFTMTNVNGFAGNNPDVPFASPEELSSEPAFQQSLTAAQEILSAVGAEYMSLGAVKVYGDIYELYFVRSINGYAETYVHLYPVMHQGDDNGEAFMPLWGAESFVVATDGSEVICAKWNNPSKVVSVDNPNTKIIPFDEAREVFLKYMDHLLRPNAEHKVGEVSVANDVEKIVITRIELGLTKVLIKNSGGQYKLISTWNFMGYEDYGNGKNMGAETCFVTVNALDKSIINRNLGY